MYLNLGDVITIGGGHVGHYGANYHNKKEEDLTKDLAILTVNKLNKLGFKAIDVSPLGSYSTDQKQLTAEINNANKYNAKLHLCLHFNACASHNGVGTESWIYSLGGNAETYAKQICNEISKSGFTNRGIKVNNKYRVPKETKAPCVLQEICFMDNLSDLNKYNPDNISNDIVKAITGLTYPGQDNHGVKYRVISDAFGNKDYALTKQQRLKDKNFNSFLDFKNNKYYVVVGSFESNENAAKREKEIKDNGFNAFIEIIK